MKKAQELSLKTIVLIILAILVLFIVGLFFLKMFYPSQTIELSEWFFRK